MTLVAEIGVGVFIAALIFILQEKTSDSLLAYNEKQEKLLRSLRLHSLTKHLGLRCRFEPLWRKTQGQPWRGVLLVREIIPKQVRLKSNQTSRSLVLWVTPNVTKLSLKLISHEKFYRRQKTDSYPLPLSKIRQKYLQAGSCSKCHHLSPGLEKFLQLVFALIYVEREWIWW
jgi:hypothetical protein